MTEPTRIINCPNCKKPTPWIESNQFRPFCSRRCRLIDLGDWANEQNSIAAQESHDDIMSSATSDAGS